MSFFTQLQERAQQIESLLCVGLDPHRQDLLAFNPPAVKYFCLRIIEATSDLALAYKPNAAFFEALGPEGSLVLQEVIAAIPPDVPVILDAKRGDISSTAEAYAEAVFKVFGANAVTLSPYLGHDSLAPFLSDPSHGAFLLCKTSNPGAADLQDLQLVSPYQQIGGEPETLYERVARMAQEWNIQDNLGLVVGATYPDALKRARQAAPDLWILAPGVGAQGGDLRQALQAGLRQDGYGMLLPVSRQISRAENPRQAADELRLAIEKERQTFLKTGVELRRPPNEPSATATRTIATSTHDVVVQLVDGLLAAGCVKFGQFTLKSGLSSPIYLDLRQLVSNPELLKQAALAYLPILQQLSFDRLAALPYAALPIGTAISLYGGWPLIYPRKEVKEYGTRAEIEGEYKPGERVVVIDDLATTGGSKFEAIDKLVSAGLEVKDVVVLIDRQSGAAESLAEHGYAFHAVFTLSEFLDICERTGKVPLEKIVETRRFLAG